MFHRPAYAGFVQRLDITNARIPHVRCSISYICSLSISISRPLAFPSRLLPPSSVWKGEHSSTIVEGLAGIGFPTLLSYRTIGSFLISEIRTCDCSSIAAPFVGSFLPWQQIRASIFPESATSAARTGSYKRVVARGEGFGRASHPPPGRSPVSRSLAVLMTCRSASSRASRHRLNCSSSRSCSRPTDLGPGNPVTSRPSIPANRQRLRNDSLPRPRPSPPLPRLPQPAASAGERVTATSVDDT